MPEHVFRGACGHCGERTRVQTAWIAYGISATQRRLCRRCWRVYTRQHQILTPQAAGKRIKKVERLTAAQDRYEDEPPIYGGPWSACRHGVSGEASCSACANELHERQRRRAAREDRIRQRAREEALERRRRERDQLAAYTSNTIFSSTLTNNWWTLDPTPATPEEPEEDEVLF